MKKEKVYELPLNKLIAQLDFHDKKEEGDLFNRYGRTKYILEVGHYVEQYRLSRKDIENLYPHILKDFDRIEVKPSYFGFAQKLLLLVEFDEDCWILLTNYEFK